MRPLSRDVLRGHYCFYWQLSHHHCCCCYQSSVVSAFSSDRCFDDEIKETVNASALHTRIKNRSSPYMKKVLHSSTSETWQRRICVVPKMQKYYKKLTNMLDGLPFTCYTGYNTVKYKFATLKVIL